MRKISVAALAVILCSLALNGEGGQGVGGYWQGLIVREGKEWRVNVEFAAGDKASVDFPDVGAYGREFSVRYSPPKVRLERAQPGGGAVVFDGTLAGDAASGEWSGLGVQGTFSLKRAVKPEAYWREDEVTFKNGGVTLAGTVILPKRGGRHPAVIFTHGGAAENRHTSREQALMLAARGVASLTYDKRGVGQSTGDWRVAGLTDLAADALAGLRLLQARPDIDARQIGIFGHSQGGWVAPLAAAKSPDVAFVVVSAASAVNAAEQSVYHRGNVIREAGFPEAAAAKAAELRRRLYETARTGASREQLKADVERVHREEWFELSALPHPVPTDERVPAGVLEMLFLEPVPVWERVTVPVLAVWGDKDTVVPVAQGPAVIGQALKKAGNKKFTFKVFPGVDHSALTARAKDAAWDFPRRAPGYFEYINDWVLSQVKVRR